MTCRRAATLEDVIGRGVFIAQVASRTLKRASITAPPVDVKTVADYLGIILVPVPSWPGGAHAQWQPSLREIRYKAEDPLVRQRFSIGHEFGHILLGHDPLTFSSVVDEERDDYAEDTLEAREREADRFAGELLLPKAWVTTDWQRGLRWDALAGRYAMSRDAVGVAVLRYKLVE